jgi:hypothetical protein
MEKTHAMDMEGEVATPQNALASATTEIVEAVHSCLPHSREGWWWRAALWRHSEIGGSGSKDTNESLGPPDTPVGSKLDRQELAF